MRYEVVKNFDGPDGRLSVGAIVDLNEGQMPSGRLDKLVDQRYLRVANDKESRRSKQDGIQTK